MFSGFTSACRMPRFRRNDNDVSSCTAMLLISGSENVRVAVAKGRRDDGDDDGDEAEDEEDEGAVMAGERKHRGCGGGTELSGSPKSSRTRQKWPLK
jgi:hypothetical protein